jgi:signal recognition particle receptor subunit alpha
MLQYKLDNEFELVYVAGFQKVLQLSYVDKFLNDIHREIRDRYKNDLSNKKLLCNGLDLKDLYKNVLEKAEIWSFEISKQPKVMRSFEESKKSKKTVASMIDRPGGGDQPDKKNKKEAKNNERKSVNNNDAEDDDNTEENDENVEQEINFDSVQLPAKMTGKGGVPGVMKKNQKNAKTKPLKPTKEKAGKKATVWDLGGNQKDVAELDFSSDKSNGTDTFRNIEPSRLIVGKGRDLRPLQVEEDDRDQKTESSGRVLNLFKGLVSGKTLTPEDTTPVLEKLKDHLIAKNVAADVAYKLCDSVGAKLHGKVLGTFQTVSSTVKAALEESLLALLRPKRQVDVLREALEAKRQGRPFVVTFCGVNGVGKSTNLAKICFWLIENDLKVLVAACDTFRAGAVEQLRTHARHLNALHPPKNGVPSVQLYEKGYGKDAAGVAAEAISFAKDNRIDVVLVDTAGRMQDNEPLMRALSKLMRVNDPDLVLFVGEALVGNEAVDQLVKFNRALADFSDQANPRLIDGIVLTKFDTIDDKVGAAVSMAYITGQPIVFVGTGQTYTDLRALDSRAVVAALMK